MILAAGFGKRLMPMTRNTPKALVRIKGIPLIEIVARKLVSQGFKEIAVNVHHFADDVISYAESKKFFGAEISFYREESFPLGTGGGIFNARNFFKDSKQFLVHNVDIISDTNLLSLYDYHAGSSNLATLSVKKRDTMRHLLFDENGFLLKRKTSSSKYSNPGYRTYAFSGIQCVSSSIFFHACPKLPFSIIDFYLSKPFRGKIGFQEDDGSMWFDAGKKETVFKIEDSDLKFCI